MLMKFCSYCKIQKEISEFGKKKNGGTQSLCRLCNIEYHKEHYKRNKESYLRGNEKRKKRRVQWLTDLKKTLCCEICGEHRPACLDFHHTNPNEKDRNISSTLGWSIGRIEREIAKCKVLCSNCHRVLHWSNLG